MAAIVTVVVPWSLKLRYHQKMDRDFDDECRPFCFLRASLLPTGLYCHCCRVIACVIFTLVFGYVIPLVVLCDLCHATPRAAHSLEPQMAAEGSPVLMAKM